METIELILPDTSQIDFQIAFVGEPATESNFMAFNKINTYKFKEVDKARRIVMGYFMIADKDILRYDTARGSYNVKFTAPNVDKIVHNWALNGLNKNLNENHQTNKFADGVYVLSHWQIDSTLGILPPKDFAVEADRSWFGVVYCANEEIYQKCIDGTYNGFSIENVFEEQKMSIAQKLDKFLSEIKTTIKK